MIRIESFKMPARIWILGGLLFFGCKERSQEAELAASERKIEPVVITEVLPHDSDDPAIWVNPHDPSQSLILGNDKDSLGGIYAFDLGGRIVQDLAITPVARPNNIDVEYGFRIGDTLVDIAVFTERYTEKIRVISLPNMLYIDGDGIPVFVNENSIDERAPMGIGLYKDPFGGEIYAIVSRKFGPADGSYLWQYRLTVNENGDVTGERVRKFGNFIGRGEIEAIAVDDELGYVFYADEAAGIRKYWAHPDSGNVELALFGSGDFREDSEGIAILKTGPGEGWLVISDQQANRFLLYPRQGDIQSPHQHHVAGAWNLSTIETDGSEVYHGFLSPEFPKGIFVAMSEGGVFHYYDLRQLEEWVE